VSSLPAGKIPFAVEQRGSVPRVEVNLGGDGRKRGYRVAFRYECVTKDGWPTYSNSRTRSRRPRQDAVEGQRAGAQRDGENDHLRWIGVA
jgi:hypothetical protein